MSTVISVENLSKKYIIRHEKEAGYATLRDQVAGTAKQLGRFIFRPGAGRVSPPKKEEFWALKEISFQVRQGERVGIIGRNGAGKSTLLKVLSRITEPTSGRVSIKGRVSSLLEVGTGFHAELTGRENIYLNGAILGMTRAEINRKFDEIVAFAEVHKFLDTPVKRYSSGMAVRLAFAVAAHLEPEILLVDEVLAVGDAKFQQKCLGKMEEVSKKGRTVFFVSHNMAAIQVLCTRAIRLDGGEMIGQGDVAEQVGLYLSSIQMEGGAGKQICIGETLELEDYFFTPNPVMSGAPVEFQVKLKALRPVNLTELSLLFYTPAGARIANVDLRRKGGVPYQFSRAGNTHTIRGRITTLPLVEGKYHLGLFAYFDDSMDTLYELVDLNVINNPEYYEQLPYPANARGVVELETCLLK